MWWSLPKVNLVGRSAYSSASPSNNKLSLKPALRRIIIIGGLGESFFRAWGGCHMMMMVSAVLGGWLLLLELLPFESSSLKPNWPNQWQVSRMRQWGFCASARGNILAVRLVCSWTYLCCRIIVYFTIQRALPRWIWIQDLSAESRWSRLEACKRNFTVLSTVKSYAMHYYYTTSSPLWSLLYPA